MSLGTRKMGLGMATMLVAGNMIGTGIFLLPTTLAAVGGISVFGWVVATAGAFALGAVFAKLGQLDPQPGGPYAYARDFLGPYVGFQTNYVYWFANWVGNVATAVAVVGYLIEFFPFLAHPVARMLANLAVIWALTFANILGPRAVGWLESATMGLALVPILGVAFFGWLWFDPAVFMAGWNVSGESDAAAVSRAAAVALWAFMGVESASVSAGVIENPHRNVPLATLLGLAIAAVVYVLCSTVIMGILPNEVLRNAHAPFAEVARLALGDAAVWVIALCAILKSVGSLGGWILLTGQTAKAAADDGMFPAVFARTNAHGVPAPGLLIVAVLMSVVVVVTASPTVAGQFARVIDIAVMLTVLPFLYASIAVWKVCYVNAVPRAVLYRYVVIGLLAASYCVWVIMGAHPTVARNGMIVMLLSVPLYPFFIRSMREAAERKRFEALMAENP